jgi:DNA-binding NarL/FixJ family response regulator
MSGVGRSVLIIDDNESFRRIARRLLAGDGFDVVGEAATGGAGVAEARRLRPFLAVLDVGLPDVDGFEVAERLAELDDPPMVVLVSSHDGADFGSLVERSRAIGFVPKARLSGAAIDLLLAGRCA